MSEAPGDPSAPPAPASESPQARLARGLELLRGGASLRHASTESGTARTSLRRAAIAAGIRSPFARPADRAAAESQDSSDGGNAYVMIVVEELNREVGELRQEVQDLRHALTQLSNPALAASLERVPPIEDGTPTDEPEDDNGGG